MINRPTQNPPYSADLALRMLIAGISTGLAHPLRVLLNEASVTTNPFMTIKNAYSKLFRDVLINAIRGTSSIGLQSIVRHHVNEYFGYDTYLGRMAGVAGACAAGVCVTPIEVVFMRQNALRAIQSYDAMDSVDSVKIKQGSLIKYNRAILAFFTARELGFCISVFGTENLSYYQKLPFLVTSALMTAVAHKLAVIEITKDIRQISHLVPDYNIGIRAAFKNIAYGDTYLHESFKMSKVKPKSSFQLAVNFFSATCGSNMFFFRLVYLAAFASIFSAVNNSVRNAYQYSCLPPENDIIHGNKRDNKMEKKM